jgi:2-polyprenyl-3-methyl-5-hydroxy-6-metoxy-1,4-benzoquinol methylase
MKQRLQQAFWSLYGRFVWDAEQPAWRQAQIKRVVGILASRQAHPGERVLDAGCGTGNYALALARAGFAVVGIDYAAGMLASARA